ncbi:hypothetical protein [Rhodoferax sp.]|uniref:hypothetical protein n=1 Tax=Rhodoferax sp. TaxID=50421 RepID=UPI002744AFE7|nr:hypothetical protein [Rhodoferax sp.]
MASSHRIAAFAIQDVWRRHLEALVEQEGKGRRGLRAVADLSGVSEEYLYQIITGKLRSNGKPAEIGKSTARKIALAFAQGRPEDWFDTEPTSKLDVIANSFHPRGVVGVSATPTPGVEATIAPYGTALSDRALDLAMALDAIADPKLKRDIYVHCITYIETGQC